MSVEQVEVVGEGAYERGYAEGLKRGYSDGYNAGSIDGYEKGKSEGYTEGHSVGYNEGYSVGYETGYSKGYEDGKKAGYTEGYTEGETKGYASGETDGYNKGHSDGVIDGKNAEYDRFWDNVLNYGDRTDFEYAFSDWGAEYLRPTYKVMPTSRSISMFRRCKVKKLESQYFDLSNCSVAQAAGTSGHHNTFNGCSALEEIEDIGLPAGGYYQTYQGCISLLIIHVWRVTAETTFSNPFAGCSSLRHIGVFGDIGNAVSFASSPDLDEETVDSIADSLIDLTGQASKKVSFHTNVILRMTEEQALRIYSKNWTF